MAIDTRNKRASVIGYKLPWRGPLPLPDGEIDPGDRRHLVGEYRGFADAGAPGGPGGRDTYIIRRRRAGPR